VKDPDIDDYEILTILMQNMRDMTKLALIKPSANTKWWVKNAIHP